MRSGSGEDVGAVVAKFTEIVAAAAGDEGFKDCTWVLLTEAYDGGGWGL